MVASRLGEIDDAFRLLELAVEGRSRGIPWVGADPDALPLRAAPRFAELLERLDLPDARRMLAAAPAE